MSVSELYPDVQPKVFHWLIAKTRNYMVAEDISADVWCRALAAEQRGRTIEPGYIWQSAANALTDRSRRPFAIPLDDSYDPPAQADAGNEELAIAQLLSEPRYSWLTPLQRSVVYLRALGYAHEEIASITGVSVVASKKLLSRAREHAQTNPDVRLRLWPVIGKTNNRRWFKQGTRQERRGPRENALLGT